MLHEEYGCVCMHRASWNCSSKLLWLARKGKPCASPVSLQSASSQAHWIPPLHGGGTRLSTATLRRTVGEGSR